MQKSTEAFREQVIPVREKVNRVAKAVVTETTNVSATASRVGAYIREQRSADGVSLRELARTAGVSNPYLSQVERGLRKPSVEVLAAIARGLKIPAEWLYDQTGILDRRTETDHAFAAIRSDPALSERHKAVLFELYQTYVREHAAASTRASSRPRNVPSP